LGKVWRTFPGRPVGSITAKIPQQRNRQNQYTLVTGLLLEAGFSPKTSARLGIIYNNYGCFFFFFSFWRLPLTKDLLQSPRTRSLTLLAHRGWFQSKAGQLWASPSGHCADYRSPGRKEKWDKHRWTPLGSLLIVAGFFCYFFFLKQFTVLSRRLKESMSKSTLARELLVLPQTEADRQPSKAVYFE